MARKTSARAAPRIRLSRERVLSAAVALADEGGIDALSMRKLAQELGVEAMSLYNHVANKDDVLDGVVEAVAAEIDAPSAGGDWKTAIRQSSISRHDTLLRHPWAPSLWMRQKPGPARLRQTDALLGTLRGAGFSKDLTYHAYHILESYVLGYIQQVLNYRAVDMRQFEDLAASFVRGDYAEEYPHFTEHVQQHMEPHEEDGGSAFGLGLDLILDGLERLRDAPDPASARG
jgi:AcrR family transcriptional regulator